MYSPLLMQLENRWCFNCLVRSSCKTLGRFHRQSLGIYQVNVSVCTALMLVFLGSTMAISALLQLHKFQSKRNYKNIVSSSLFIIIYKNLFTDTNKHRPLSLAASLRVLQGEKTMPKFH